MTLRHSTNANVDQVIMIEGEIPMEMDRKLNRRLFVRGMAGSAAMLATLPLLAACGGDDDEDGGESASTSTSGSGAANTPSTAATATSGSTGSGSAASSPTTAGSTGSGETTKIVYWGSFSGALGEAEHAVVQQFNESQTEVEVEYQFQGTYEETAQKLTQALAADQVPDVLLLSDVWWFKFYLNQKLAAMDDFMATYEVDKDDFVDSLYIEGVRDDVLYWLPFARSTPLFYYNKEAWAEAGLPDRGPETWDEMVEWAPELVTDTRSAFAHPNGASYIAWLFQGVIWQFGGEYSDADFNILIDSEAGIEAGEFYRASVADGWATTPADINADFTNGLTASMMASTGGLKGIQETATFEVGTAFLPEKYQFGCCTGGAGLAIMADAPTENQDAAFRFIEFATSPEVTTFWSQNTGYMPVRKSAIASQEMAEFFEDNPNFKTAVEQLERTRPQDAARVFIPGGDQIIGGGLEEITINNGDTEEAFSEVKATLEEEAEPVLDALEALG